MVSISVTRMSSKGQIVIPANMRGSFNEGDEIILIKDDERIILKKAEKLTEQMKEDLEFARRTEEAYRRIEAGYGIKVNLEDFDKVMDSW